MNGVVSVAAESSMAGRLTAGAEDDELWLGAEADVDTLVLGEAGELGKEPLG